MLRLAHTDASQDEDTEESVTVAEAARRLGCATSTVRELLDAGQLSGHRVGKFVKGKAPRGVRVHAASIRAYQRRNGVGGHAPAAANDRQPGKVSANPGAAEARRYLRAMGML